MMIETRIQFGETQTGSNRVLLFRGTLQSRMSVDARAVQIMIVMYNAVEAGWTVAKECDNKYAFTKSAANVTEEVLADDFPSNFVARFADIDKFFEYLHGKRRRLAG